MKFTNYNPFYEDQKRFGIEYAAERTVALGFDSVEFLMAPYTEHIEDVSAARAILERYGLRVSCYSVYVQLFTSDQSEVERHMLRHVEEAAALGAKYIHHTLFPIYNQARIENSYDEVFSGIIALAERIAKECNRLGIVCLYEPQGAYFNGVDGLDRFLQEMRRRGCEVGICGDFGNSLFVDVDPREVIGRFARDIRHVHVKDYLVTDEEISERKRRSGVSGHYLYDAALGEGSVDFLHGFRALKQAGYDGAISFEIGGSDAELKSAIEFVKQTLLEAGY